MVKAAFHKILWDLKALDELKEILHYLTKQDLNAAKIVKSAIITRIEVIKTNPFIYEIDKLKDPVDKNFRAFVVFSYRVTYQIASDANEIRV